jgi:hypothetical protein
MMRTKWTPCSPPCPATHPRSRGVTFEVITHHETRCPITAEAAPAASASPGSRRSHRTILVKDLERAHPATGLDAQPNTQNDALPIRPVVGNLRPNRRSRTAFAR